MTAENPNVQWAETLVAELAAGGLEAACVTPGSRSTPLTLALSAHPDIEIFSHLDERSAGFFALGRGKRSGTPTAVVCTSGTAAANLHPAVLEAHEGQSPLLVLTADRPPELLDSGANQTTDQHALYGDAVRYHRTLPEPAVEARTLRSLRVIASRAMAETTRDPPGPVHLNVPFAKPLEPTDGPADIPDSFAKEAPLAASGRDGDPFVEVTTGRRQLDSESVAEISAAIERTQRGLIVCGPADSPTPTRKGLSDLARVSGFPVLADPLSGHRFGHEQAMICGGYDSYLDRADRWPDPDIVLRFGGSPTSKTLRTYLAETAATQFLVDPAGGWREAEFTAGHLVVTDPTRLVDQLVATLESPDSDRKPESTQTTPNTADHERGLQEAATPPTTYAHRFALAERAYWEYLDEEEGGTYFEGNILHTVATSAPPETTMFVSNSMPVRDLDRFGRPGDVSLRVLGNRGLSGIDGIVSTALGAGSATDDRLVAVLGDLALYHDMNGLLAIDRCEVDATIVVIDNDGGGIFHKLPISEFDPPFTELFVTPHGLDFEPVGELYGIEVGRVDSLQSFEAAFEAAVHSSETQLITVEIDGTRSHEIRNTIHDRVGDELDRRVHQELDTP